MLFSVQNAFPFAIDFKAFPSIFSIRFTVSFPLHKSLLHLEVSFVHGGKYGFMWILTYVFNCFDQHFIKDAGVFFIQCAFLAFLLKFKCPKIFGFISGFISYFRLTDHHVCFMQTSCFLIETRIQIA